MSDDKAMKTVRRTVIVILHKDVPLSTRALLWESAGRTSDRRIHRIERATPGAGVNTADNPAGEVYLIDIEYTARGANRNDLTKFIRRYVPEAEYHYITE